MRSIIQRVSKTTVQIDNNEFSSIGKGILVLLGIEDTDTIDDIEWLAGKINRLRIFNDKEGMMNLSIADVGGEFLVVSQFTLYGSTKKGNRPSYIRASKPDIAIPLYEKFVKHLNQISGIRVKTGIFGADMKIISSNDGPVTLIFDTKNKE